MDFNLPTTFDAKPGAVAMIVATTRVSKSTPATLNVRLALPTEPLAVEVEGVRQVFGGQPVAQFTMGLN